MVRKRYSQRTKRIVLLAALLALASTAACAGANGDPAPVPQEAGAGTAPACDDAGAGG
ncbi:MAG: hypothetical protein JWP87_6178 [Labilithrix sp.]|nr:hypothetical protein [Labilithrix sp.]